MLGSPLKPAETPKSDEKSGGTSALARSPSDTETSNHSSPADFPIVGGAPKTTPVAQVSP